MVEKVDGFEPGEALVFAGAADVGIGLLGKVEVGLDDGPPDPLLVHATAPTRIRTIGAAPHLRTL